MLLCFSCCTPLARLQSTRQALLGQGLFPASAALGDLFEPRILLCLEIPPQFFFFFFLFLEFLLKSIQFTVQGRSEGRKLKEAPTLSSEGSLSAFGAP